MLAVNALVVDDSRTAIMVLKNQLSQFDVVVESAPDGGRALESLRDHHPDVIFLDHVMPGLDGFQVLQRIRENQDTRNIPVVMYTSQRAPMYIKEAMNLGAIAVIPKNVTQEELAAALNKAEFFRLTAANDDFANPDSPVESANREHTVASVTPLRANLGSEPGLNNEQQDCAGSTAVDSTRTPSGIDEPGRHEEIPDWPQSAQSHDIRSSVQTPTVFLLLVLLIFFQGYDMVIDRRQHETISGLQEKLLEQERKLPQMRAELVVQQQQLRENIAGQMEFLAAILTHQPPSEEVLESRDTAEQMVKATN